MSVVNVVKIGFIGLNTSNRPAMRHHFGEVVGLAPVPNDGEAADFFACGSERHVLGIYEADRSGLRHFGLRLEQDMELAEAERRLIAAGVPAERASDRFPGIPATLRIKDPNGNTVYLYSESTAPAVPYGDKGISPIKLGHIALFVDDWTKTAPFYQEILNFRISDWAPDVFVFMRCNSEHHTLNLTNHPRGGMFHLAFEVRDFGHISRACDYLAARGILTVWGPGRHGIGHSLFAYHRDPDGNLVELFADMDRMSNEGIGYFDPRPYHEDMPQRPKAWSFDPASSNIWGTMPPEGFIS
jgi:catechol-2,3-dioxygenase